MERSRGRPEVSVGVIDGPVFMQHPDLNHERLREVSGRHGRTCAGANGAACMHGTFVTGILAAKRSSAAPAICPDCTILIRPIFTDSHVDAGSMPSATEEDLATAMLDCMDHGTQVINMSLAVVHRSSAGHRQLEDALDETVKRGVIVVVAAGNQGTLGSSILTRHAWVVPVVACDLRGQPTRESNLGRSIGQRGLSAPGEAITSLAADEGLLTLGGTSVAVPFVTGAIALLRSEFPSVSAADVRLAISGASGRQRSSVVPPLLNASAAYDALSARM
jgi:subtilisin family serine protease